MMNTYSLSPLTKHAVGFDHFDQLFHNLSKLDESAGSYPPYNIEKTSEHDYIVTLAVAGFTQDDLSIMQERGTLLIRGKINKVPENEGYCLLHKGIATRAFERKFNLADHVRVQAASLANGLLEITLHREIPEAEKPRNIQIKSI